MSDEGCKPGCRCILCNVLELLDKAAELQGGDYDKGMELILFAGGSLAATVERYPLRLVLERVSRAYGMTQRDLEAEAGNAPGAGQTTH